MSDPYERRCAECRRVFVPPKTGGRRRATCSDDCWKARRAKVVRRRKQRVDARERRFIADLIGESPGRSTVELDPANLMRFQSALLAGATVPQLAKRFGVHLRSAYRYSRYGKPEQVRVGHYAAWFAPVRDSVPVQLTEWVATTGPCLYEEGKWKSRST